MVVDGLPGRVALREVAPLHPGLVQEKQCIQDGKGGMLAEPFVGEEGLDNDPLGIRQVRAVRAWFWLGLVSWAAYQTLTDALCFLLRTASFSFTKQSLRR